MKLCKKCNTERPKVDFPDGWSPCKECRYEQRKRREKSSDFKKKKAEKDKLYYATNKKEIKERVVKYQKDNPEKVRKWRQSRQSQRNEYLRNYYQNPEKKLAHNLRTRLCRAIRKDHKSGSAVKDLGCTVTEFRSYLESLWQPGMTWDNWGRDGWHIDHIKPLTSFDLSDPGEVKKACHYTNLQPLWAKENLRKSNKTS